MARVVSLATWNFLAWIVLTWTRTAEQLAVGAGLAIVVAILLAPFGDVPGPWVLLSPRRLVGLVRLVVAAAWRIVAANVKLSARIWRPSRPLASGMIILPTREQSAAGLAAVGLITSVIVDNQLVDVDRARDELLYHAVAVPKGGSAVAYKEINGPVERLLPALEGSHEQ